MDEHRIPVSGDPFYAAANRPDEERPHGCYSGKVFIGHMAPAPETGEEVEVVEAVRCSRCADS